MQGQSEIDCLGCGAIQFNWFEWNKQTNVVGVVAMALMQSALSVSSELLVMLLYGVIGQTSSWLMIASTSQFNGAQRNGDHCELPFNGVRQINQIWWPNGCCMSQVANKWRCSTCWASIQISSQQQSAWVRLLGCSCCLLSSFLLLLLFDWDDVNHQIDARSSSFCFEFAVS